MTIKQRAVSALAWSAVERFSVQLIQFFVIIILARLLEPKDFGLIGMLTLFMALAQSFVDSGFGQALIQKQGATHLDECSIFYFNIILGLLAAGLLCLSAPLIADFYRQPLLISLTQALSINIVINSFSLIQGTLLQKHLDFKSLFKIGIGATLISGIIGIGMAYMGYGVWSLVAQSLSKTFMNNVLLWLLTSWRPAWTLSLTSLRDMFGFGSKLLFAGILNNIFVNIYPVVIGKLFSPTVLGYYAQAKQIQGLPVDTVCSIVSRVTFPFFSNMQDDRDRLKANLRKALTALTMVVFPLMVGLSVLADDLIPFIIGEKWRPTVPYVRLLCVIGALQPLHVINLNLLNALGHSDLSFKLEILKKTLVMTSIFTTYQWGVEAMLWGQIVISFAGYYLNSYYTGKFLRYSIFEQIKDFWPYLGTAVLMGVVVWATKLLFLQNTALSLLVDSTVGILAYYFLCKYFKLPALERVDTMLMTKIKVYFAR